MHYTQDNLLEIIKELHEAGCPIVIDGSVGGQSISNLVVSCANKRNIEVVKYFIDQIEDPNKIITADGYTPLMVICKFYENDDFEDVLQYFMQKFQGRLINADIETMMADKVSKKSSSADETCPNNSDSFGNAPDAKYSTTSGPEKDKEQAISQDNALTCIFNHKKEESFRYCKKTVDPRYSVPRISPAKDIRHISHKKMARFFGKKENRLATFQHWPVDFIEPEELVAAGLCYTGLGDVVSCPNCWYSTHMFKPEDSGQVEAKHRRWGCQYPEFAWLMEDGINDISTSPTLMSQMVGSCLSWVYQLGKFVCKCFAFLKEKIRPEPFYMK